MESLEEILKEGEIQKLKAKILTKKKLEDEDIEDYLELKDMLLKERCKNEELLKEVYNLIERKLNEEIIKLENEYKTIKKKVERIIFFKEKRFLKYYCRLSDLKNKFILLKYNKGLKKVERLMEKIELFLKNKKDVKESKKELSILRKRISSKEFAVSEIFSNEPTKESVEKLNKIYFSLYKDFDKCNNLYNGNINLIGPLCNLAMKISGLQKKIEECSFGKIEKLQKEREKIEREFSRAVYSKQVEKCIEQFKCLKKKFEVWKDVSF